MHVRKWSSRAIVLAWTGLIFFFSTQPAHESAQLSTSLANTLIRAAESLFISMPTDVSFLHSLMRKSAHLFLYMVLGGLSWYAFTCSGFYRIKSALYAWGYSILIAIADESVQAFVPGRAGQIGDVLIDTAGAATGIFLCVALVKIKKR